MESGEAQLHSNHTATTVNSETTGVILLGGTLGTLGAARSFGRKNIPVILITDDHPLPGLSKYVTRSVTWPGASSPQAGEWLIRFAAEFSLQNWLLIPCADGEVKFVAKNLARLRDIFTVVSSDWATVLKIADKQQLAETAAAVGIAFPKNYRIRSDDDAANADLQFPVVLKPAMRVERNPFTLSKAWRADTREEFKQLYRRAASMVGYDNVVVQELIPGGGEAQFSYAAFWHGNAPIVEMTARRTRQFPIQFSHTSTFVETIDNEAVKVAGRKLLSSVGFEGLVEIEFKFDARDGSYKVLDVNPRPWSWFALCESAGVNLAILMRDYIAGKTIAPQKALVGLAWVHPTKDTFVALQLIARGDMSVGSYIKTLGKKLVFSTFAVDDLLPGILELPMIAYRLVTRTAELARLRVHELQSRPAAKRLTVGPSKS